MSVLYLRLVPAVWLALAAFACRAPATELPSKTNVGTHVWDGLIQRLTAGSFTLTSSAGAVLGTRMRGDEAPVPLSEKTIIEAARRAPLTGTQAAALWAFFADSDNASMTSLPLVKALLAASGAPKAREALWGELASIARALPHGGKVARDRSLVGLFERHRSELQPLMNEVRETDSASDDMIDLMLKSRIFGAEMDEAVTFVSGRIPAAVARHIERKRGLGKPVYWEYAAFESMMRWKDAHLLPTGARAARTLAELDAAGASFITIFNCLHELDEGYREVILRGLRPAELFNAVVAGEKELYRLGTSGYRDFLHPFIMRGIKEAGSFEAFVENVTPARLGAVAGHRAMIFLRVASSFGFLEEVLQTVHDRERLTADVIAALENPVSFEDNSTVVLDVLTVRGHAPALDAFRRALLTRLYGRYDTERNAQLKRALGSILSVYQTLSGDRRNGAIDRDYAISDQVFHIGFDKLFAADGAGGYVHRMFMRMDENDDGVETYDSFKTVMAALGATLDARRHYDVFRLRKAGRLIEIYSNAPTGEGVRQGIANIAEALKDRRVETVIGRGHTSIIAPLQEDSKRVLGPRIRQVAAVIVGACGGDVSVREMIGTFGYIPFFATKATGRTLINNAIVKTYINALFALAPEDRLAVDGVRHRAVSRFLEEGYDDELRSDARLYQVNMTAVLSAQLFDRHLRQQASPSRSAALD